MKSAKGMTLIEVLIALTVLAIGAAGAINTVVYASRSLGTSTHVEQANMLAQSLLTALLAVPFNSTGTCAAGGVVNPTLFSNCSTTNDADVADANLTFTQDPLPAGAFDHQDSELATAPIGAMVAPLPTGAVSYQRYWNIAPMGTNGVTIAVIVRWREPAGWRRSVVIGTRYGP